MKQESTKLIERWMLRDLKTGQFHHMVFKSRREALNYIVGQELKNGYEFIYLSGTGDKIQ